MRAPFNQEKPSMNKPVSPAAGSALRQRSVEDMTVRGFSEKTRRYYIITMRPDLEIADIFRRHGPAWRAARAGHVSLDQLKVMSAIETCRTAALGGHVEGCEECGHQRIAYNSCLMGKSSNGESADHMVSTAGGFQR